LIFFVAVNDIINQWEIQNQKTQSGEIIKGINMNLLDKKCDLSNNEKC